MQRVARLCVVSGVYNVLYGSARQVVVVPALANNKASSKHRSLDRKKGLAGSILDYYIEIYTDIQN